LHRLRVDGSCACTTAGAAGQPQPRCGLHRQRNRSPVFVAVALGRRSQQMLENGVCRGQRHARLLGQCSDIPGHESSAMQVVGAKRPSTRREAQEAVSATSGLRMQADKVRPATKLPPVYPPWVHHCMRTQPPDLLPFTPHVLHRKVHGEPWLGVVSDDAPRIPLDGRRREEPVHKLNQHLQNTGDGGQAGLPNK
jgi:hypothetical protein